METDSFTDNLFPELNEDSQVLQINNGGYLSSSSKDISQLKKEFTELNGEVNLKRLSVTEAKEELESKLITYENNEKKGLNCTMCG